MNDGNQINPIEFEFFLEQVKTRYIEHKELAHLREIIARNFGRKFIIVSNTCYVGKNKSLVPYMKDAEVFAYEHKAKTVARELTQRHHIMFEAVPMSMVCK